MGLDGIFDFDDEVMKHDFVMKDVDLLIWPLIRSPVLGKIRKLITNSSKAHAKQSMISVRNIKYIFDTFLYPSHRFNDNFDIIFYTKARGRLNNKNFNFYCDYFSSLTNNKSLVIDNAFNGRYFIPDDTTDFATRDYVNLMAFLFRPLKKIFSRQRNESIECFIDFLKTKNVFEDKFIFYIKDYLYKFYYDYPYKRSYYSKLFRKLNPKIIFVQTAAYGKRNAILVKTAKEQGVVTGEFQHGTISKGHLAYNYGKSVLESNAYQEYFPDYVLTFGNYWNEQMNIPGEPVTIGAPHFYKSIEKYEHIKEKKNTVLVVSQGTMTKEFVRIAKYLAEKLPRYRIVFKLHPGEVSFEERYKTLYRYDNVIIAKSGDIYKYIAECEHIVACYSTTVFEAMGFNKKIYVLDNEQSRIYIPEDVGIRFKENKELEELIKNNDEQGSNYDLEYYFNPNWKKNYEKFLEETVDIR